MLDDKWQSDWPWGGGFTTLGMIKSHQALHAIQLNGLACSYVKYYRDDKISSTFSDSLAINTLLCGSTQPDGEALP